MKNNQEEIGEDGFMEESEDQKKYGNYCAYLELKKINYTDEQIASQLYCSVEEFEKLKAKFE